MAAKKFKKPVRLILTRKEDISITGQRHESLVEYKVLANKSTGKICSAKFKAYCNGGISTGKYLSFKTIFVHNMFSPCSAKRRASDKDLPVQICLFLGLWHYFKGLMEVIHWKISMALAELSKQIRLQTQLFVDLVALRGHFLLRQSWIGFPMNLICHHWKVSIRNHPCINVWGFLTQEPLKVLVVLVWP